MDFIKFADIISKVLEHNAEVVSLDYTPFMTVLQGSQNYQLEINTPEYQSDVDTKSIVLPSFDDFVRGRQPVSVTHVRENDEHIDIKDIRNYFDLIKKQNMNIVETLFTPYWCSNGIFQDEIAQLRELNERLAHAHTSQAVKTMYGMAMEKFKALEHPYPSIKYKIDKWGYDGKQLHHIIRIWDFIQKFISGEPYSTCLIPSSENVSLLIDAKLNKPTLEEARDLAQYYIDKIEKIKVNYIEQHGESIDDPEAYKELDHIKFKVLKKWFRKQLEM